LIVIAVKHEAHMIYFSATEKFVFVALYLLSTARLSRSKLIQKERIELVKLAITEN